MSDNKFRWLPGMLAEDTDGVRYRVAGVTVEPEDEDDPDFGGVWLSTITDEGGPWEVFPLSLRQTSVRPVFSDAATRGCLLALVREAWRDPGLACVTSSYTHENGYQYRVVGGHHHGSKFMAMSQKMYPLEEDALRAALEAVP